jgi:site-specific DNA recombinase
MGPMSTAPYMVMSDETIAALTQPTAVLYLRVSSAGQVNKAFDPEGYSLPGQRAAGYRHAERLGAAVIAEFVEPGRTGTNMQRPALRDMLAALPDLKPTYVIFYDLSRVARDDFDALWLLREIEGLGAKLESTMERVDDTPAGKLLYTVMAGVNAFRSRGDGEKVKMGLERKHLDGGSNGPARLGYLNVREDVAGRSVASITTDPIRAPHIKVGFDLFATGQFTISALVDVLEEAGLRTRPTAKRPSRPVSRSSLHRILRDDYYTGIVTQNGVKVVGRHEPLISRAVFEQVQQVLDAHRASGERTQKHKHFLHGSIFCPCGRRLGYGRHRSKSGTYYEYFSCLSRVAKGGSCGAPYLPVADVEDAVARHVANERLSHKDRERVREAVEEYVEPLVASAKQEAARHERRMRELLGEQQNLVQLYYRKLVSEEILAAEQARIEKERTEIERWREAAKRESDDVLDALDETLRALDAEEWPYEDASPTVRRLLLQTLFVKLIISAEAEGVHGVRQPLYEEIHALAEDLRQDGPKDRHTIRSRRGIRTKNTGPSSLGRCSHIDQMAEGAGFEPADGLRHLRFSRPVH